MVLFIGSLTRVILFTVYTSLAIVFLLNPSVSKYKVQLFNAKAFMDCSVDNDNNPYTCISSYTMVKIIKIPINILISSAFLFSAFFNIVILLVDLRYIVRHIENIIVNTLIISLISIMGGIQEIKFLSILIACIISMEFMYFYHDFDNDNMSIKLYASIWIIQFMTWFIIILSNIYYIANSYPIPFFIPSFVGVGLFFMFVIRILHFKTYYFYVIPTNKGYGTIDKDEAYYVNWLESWTNIIYLVQRVSMACILFYGSIDYQITYI